MNTIFHFLNFEKLRQTIKNVFSRFPVSIGILFFIALVFFIIIHGDWSDFINNRLIQGIMSLVITFFLSIGIYIFSESINQSPKKKYMTQLFPLIFGGLLFLSFSHYISDFENFILFILNLFGIIAFLFVAPYIKNIITKTEEQGNYYVYFYKISLVFLLSFILGGVLSFLGMIALSAIFTLFDLRGILSEKIYSDWMIIALVCITPFFGLSKLPTNETFSKNDFNENIFFSFLVKYIAIPFIYIYFIILYLYSAKVLIHFGEWPKGEVSWLVIGFSIFGYLAYIFSYIFEEKIKHIQFFRKIFPFVVIPQICMLFYAIYLRIYQYDITINRYFVVIFGIWLFIISLYYIFSKKKYLGFIPLILTFFIIIISIGPWSVYKLPETRQLTRLKNNLIDAHILQNGEIIIPNKSSDIDKNLAKKIYDGISYLCDFDNCKNIKLLFSQEYNALANEHKKNFEENKINEFKNTTDLSERGRILKREYREMTKWEILSSLTAKLKIQQEYFSSLKNDSQEFIEVYIDSKSDSFFPIEFGDYEFITNLNETNNNSLLHVKIIPELQTLEVLENGKITEKTSIKVIEDQILQKINTSGNPALSKENLIYELETEYYKIKLFFSNLSIKNPKYIKTDENNNSYTNVDGYALIKRK